MSSTSAQVEHRIKYTRRCLTLLFSGAVCNPSVNAALSAASAVSSTQLTACGDSHSLQAVNMADELLKQAQEFFEGQIVRLFPLVN